MKKQLILILSLFIFVSSCKTLKIEPLHTELIILRTFDDGDVGCYMAPFEISESKVGRKRKPVRVKLTECSNIIGFRLYSENKPDFSEFRAWIEYVFNNIKDVNDDSGPVVQF